MNILNILTILLFKNLYYHYIIYIILLILQKKNIIKKKKKKNSYIYMNKILCYFFEIFNKNIK